MNLIVPPWVQMVGESFASYAVGTGTGNSGEPMPTPSRPEAPFARLFATPNADHDPAPLRSMQYARVSEIEVANSGHVRYDRRACKMHAALPALTRVPRPCSWSTMMPISGRSSHTCW